MFLSILFDFWLLVSLVAILFPIIAVVDILRRDLLTLNKIFWIAIVLFAPILGSVIYFFYRKPYRVRK